MCCMMILERLDMLMHSLSWMFFYLGSVAKRSADGDPSGWNVNTDPLSLQSSADVLDVFQNAVKTADQATRCGVSATI